MNRKEQIKEAALKECSSFDIPDKEVRFRGVNSAYGLGFCEGAMGVGTMAKHGGFYYYVLPEFKLEK